MFNLHIKVIICLTNNSCFPSRMGAHFLNNNGNVGAQQDIDIEDIILHSDFGKPLKASNDIALLKLVKPGARLGKGVGLACLPDCKLPLPLDGTKKCWITGWGYIRDNDNNLVRPNVLREAEIPVVGLNNCVLKFGCNDIDGTMLCAGFARGQKDACTYDSGGPLVCEFKGKFYLEGITSFGSRGCVTYGVYANVRFFLKRWIQPKIYPSKVYLIR